MTDMTNFSAQLLEVKNASLKAIQYAIATAKVGGQGYTWYTDSEGKVWVIQLNFMHKDDPLLMECFTKGVSVTEGWQPSDRSLLADRFSVDELARLADQCTNKTVAGYKVSVYVNGSFSHSAGTYATIQEAKEKFSYDLKLRVGDKVETKIEPVVDWIIRANAKQQYQKEETIRQLAAMKEKLEQM